MRRIQFGENNWVDVAVEQTRVTIKDYSPDFEGEALGNFQLNHRDKIEDRENLRDFCQKNSYQTNNGFSARLTGQLHFFANPLHWDRLRLTAFKVLNETITEVTNPFVIKNKEITIFADFLSEEEKAMIASSGHLKDFDELDALAIRLFNPWVGPGEELSSLLARLICGMADNKASIVYRFQSEDGESLKMKINRISFKR